MSFLSLLFSKKLSTPQTKTGASSVVSDSNWLGSSQQLLTKQALMLIFVGLILSGCSEQKDPVLAAVDSFIEQQSVDKSHAGWKRNLNKPPKLSFATDKQYFWHLRTNKGNIVIKMLPQIAPMHVSSTFYLTRLGFYDGLHFHRVITGFMAQGGDPMGNGMGGPGYYYEGEFSADARHSKAGILSMANRGENTDGSQFFLTFKATPHLDDRHTVFGEVVEGFDVLKVIEALGSRSGKPQQELTIISATVSVK
jgi:peptidyl-prolyl cis-trans isomerase B (cyclophilin B)